MEKTKSIKKIYVVYDEIMEEIKAVYYQEKSAKNFVNRLHDQKDYVIKEFPIIDIEELKNENNKN